MQKCIKFLKGLKSPRTALAIGISMLLLDIITKTLVMEYIYTNDYIKVCSGFNITNVHNHGFSFGMLDDVLSPIWIAFFSLIAIFAIIVLTVRNRDMLFFSILIVCGGLGNVIDRFRYGFVVDFIDLYVWKWHWPSFNVADCIITFGIFSYFLIFIWDTREMALSDKY